MTERRTCMGCGESYDGDTRHVCIESLEMKIESLRRQLDEAREEIERKDAEIERLSIDLRMLWRAAQPQAHDLYTDEMADILRRRPWVDVAPWAAEEADRDDL